MKTAKNQTTKIYRRKCEELDILIYYRMLLQRISRHLSPEEVSFLMGKPLDFLSKIERFKLKRIFVHDLVTMYNVLEINSMSAMMPLGVELSSQKNLYELHVTTLADRVIYDMYKVDVEQDQKVIEFKLIDARHDIDHYKNSTAEEVKKISAFLDDQIDAGYFNEEKRPDEIHNFCCVKLEKYIDPKNLMKVLDDLLNWSDERKINRQKSKYGFAYVLAAHAKSTEKK
ncbi:hypothetical protein ACK8HY_17440 [Sphingobacterium sp. NGMCC 1.201703]|jgi:hypothetical protein|uniref:hypothetical protein n=1 Tax=Sphingobacterium sp. NGMCC 1.201703 TaxID=3388657 RepID=UPI0039FCBB7C